MDRDRAVDHEANMRAAAAEAEMWRAKDRLAERLTHIEVAAAFQKNRADTADAEVARLREVCADYEAEVASLRSDLDELAALREAVIRYRARIAEAELTISDLLARRQADGTTLVQVQGWRVDGLGPHRAEPSCDESPQCPNLYRVEES